MTKSVLFDLDGTLLDTERDFTRILNTQLASYGRAPVNTQQMRNTVSNGARAMIQLGFGIEDSHPDFNSHLEEFLDRYQQCISKTECVLFPGIANLLETLDHSQVPWGIVTNKPSRFTLPLVEQFPALRGSRVLVCADHVKISKPDPEGIMLACRKLQCEADTVLYVGDHPKDVQAAAAAGAMSIAVRWGYLPAAPAIENWQADLVINHPDDLLEHINKHINKSTRV